MNLNHELIVQQELNGQHVYILDPEAFGLLMENPTIEDQPIRAMDMVCNMIEFVQTHKSFSLAFYPLGKHKMWMFCLLFYTGEDLQRVQIENTRCDNCNWEGIIANPTIPELYFGCPNEWEALNRAYESPKVNCPSCNGTLSRHAIWISN